MAAAQLLPPLPLPPGVTSRLVDLTAVPSCGLRMHVLEAGARRDPLVLLLHGYPELAFTWRKVLAPLARRGFHVVAPDSRGYGRTTGWDAGSFAHASLARFTQHQLVCDYIALIRALGHEHAAAVVGHDFGAGPASACVLARPDLFRAGVFMSHVPGGGLPLPPLDGAPPTTGGVPRDPDVHTSLARLDPPRVHYQWYNSTAPAAQHWEQPPQGLRAFLRGYVHLKSHAWKGNTGAGPLAGWTADQLARMPGYYIMPLGETMPQVVEREMRGEDAAATAGFVSDAELDVYVAEFARTGFQGALNWYRSATDPHAAAAGAMALFAGRTLDVPTAYIGGVADWGNYQRPGALEALQGGVTATDFRGAVILEGAGHWPQTEAPERCVELIATVLAGGRIS